MRSVFCRKTAVLGLVSGLLPLGTIAAVTPTAVTLGFTNVASTGATLNGSVTPNGPVTTAYFQYGLDPNYGSYSVTNYSGGLGVALQFNGTNGYLSVPGFGLVAPSPEITIEFWQYANKVTNQSTFLLNPDDPANRLAMSSPWSDGNTYWDYGNLNTSGRLGYSPAGLTNSWQHFAVVASKTNNAMMIYRNGVLEAQKAGVKPFGQGNYELRIGAGATNAFAGSINEFRVWNSVVDPTTIQQWMNSSLTSAHPYYSNLVAYWPMNDGSGTAAADGSGRGHPGTLVSGVTWGAGQNPANLPATVVLAGLQPGTTYHFRLVAVNANGTNAGTDMTFITQDVPSVETLAASGLASTNAVLNASVNPNGLATTAYFQYGLDTNYGTTTAVTNLFNGTAYLGISTVISNLQPGAVYHYQAVASNPLGTYQGADMTFTALSAAPAAATFLASAFTGNNALLAGTFNPNGAPTSAWFQYGTTTNYGSATSTNLNVNLAFDGTGYVSIPDFGLVMPTNEITVEFWEWVNAAVQQSTFQLVSDNAANRLNGHVPWSDGAVYWDFGNINAGGRLAYNPPVPIAGSWQQFSLVASRGNNSMSIYRNGVREASQSGSSTLTQDGRALRLGLSFAGLLRDFRVWNRALDATTIQTWYNSNVTAAHPYYTNLVGYWPMNIASATVTDQSGHGFAGIMTPGVQWNANFLLTGLSPGVTYHFRLVASNSLGAAYGNDLAFGPPAATTLAASLTNSTRAVVGAVVNPNGVPTSVYYQYGTTTGYGLTLALGNFGNGSTNIAVTNTFVGLQQATLYHYRVVASNACGVTPGADLTFTTPLFQTTNTVTGLFDSGPGSLRQAILNANASSGAGIIDLTGISGSIVLNSALPIISQDMVINGPGAANLTISGNYQYRVFFVDDAGGSVSINNLTIANGLAQGGNGGSGYLGGGGGLGAGAGLFLNAGALTLTGVRFTNNAAIGGNGGGVAGAGGGGGGGLSGNGGNYTGGSSSGGGGGGYGGDGGNTTLAYGSLSGGGGGGGLAGSGGDGSVGGGGGGGTVANGQSASGGTGGPGGLANGGNGATYQGRNGLANGAGGLVGGGGGGGAWGFPFGGYDGGAGGPGGKYGGGGGATDAGTGGNGGDFGGGGGADPSFGYPPPLGTGGSGGFGGGGGSSGGGGGANGGFGGGGGGLNFRGGFGGPFGGHGSYAAPYAGSAGGGGGALGASVFVRADNGASLTFVDSVADAGLLTPGSRGAIGSYSYGPPFEAVDGGADGTGFFFLGGTNLFTISSGTTTLPGSIGGWAGSPGGLIKNGAGTLILSAASDYPGPTFVNAGTLQIVGSIASSSSVTVGAGAMLSGNGSVGPLIIGSGAILSPGPGVVNLNAGNTVWSGAGNYNWLLYDAAGAAGVGYSRLNVNGTLDVSAASGFNVNMGSLSSVSPGASGNAIRFTNTVSQSWIIASTSGGILGFNPANFNIITAANNGTGGFSNPLGGGQLALAVVGNNLVLSLSFPPSVVTLAASSITASNAVLNASVNPNGLATTVYVQYGADTNYGSVSATNTIYPGPSAVSVARTITGLSVATVYHYRIVAVNQIGTTYGSDSIVTSAPAAPAAVTLAATSVNSTNAALNASINPGGAATTVYFRYGLDIGYGSFSATNTLTADTNPAPISSSIGSLASSTLYHFQVVAVNSAGVSFGSDLTFQTLVQAALVITLPASSILTGSAVLNGLINPNGSVTTAYFQYGLDTNYGNFTATNFAGSIYLQAPAGRFVNIPGFGLVLPTNEITVEFWQYANATADQSTFHLNPDDPANRFNAHVPYSDGNVVWDFGNIYNTGRLVYTPPVSAAGSWQHFALVASQSGNYMAIYRNGVLEAQKSGSAVFARVNAALELGLGGAGQFAGQLREYRVWNQALDALTIQSWYGRSVDSTHPYYTNLVAYWPMSDATGTNAADLSGHNYNGTVLNGAAWSNSLAQAVLSGLSPSTTYHFRAVGTSSVGTSFGDDLSFTTAPPAAPSVTTLAASSVTANAATLNASVNPNAAATKVFFRYGLDTSYGGFSATNSLSAVTLPIAVNSAITGLAPGVTYHFQVVGMNSAGTNYGADLAFTAAPAAPISATLAASAITGTGAVLSAGITPSGAATAYYFQYGLTTGYGNFSSTNNLGAAPGSNAVNITITSLSYLTTYHYQVVASNSMGINVGGDLTFTTLPNAPFASTQPASGVTGSNAVLNAFVTPNNAATVVFFQYGLDISYGSYSATNQLSANTESGPVNVTLSGLAPNTRYHYYVVAANSGGSTSGADLTFLTSPLAPTVTTLPATGLTSGTAVLNASILQNGGASTLYFQYGLDTGYGSFTSTNYTGAPYFNNNPASVPGFGLIMPTNEITIEFWQNVNSPTTQSGFQLTPDDPSNRLNAHNPWVDGNFYWDFGDIGAAGRLYYQPPVSIAGSWQHFALVASQSGNYLAIYRNGILEAEQPGMSVFRQVNEALQFGLGYIGQLREFRIWNRALDGVTINSWLYSSVNTTHPNWTNLVAYWPMGENNGTNFFDQSGGANIATLANSPVWMTAPSQALLTGLTPSTTYHFRAVGSNAQGITAGTDLSFATAPAAAPQVNTLAPANVAPYTGTLPALVNPNGQDTSVYFRYGQDTTYGQFSATNSLPAATLLELVTNNVTGLLPGTLYHFQAVGINSSGVTLGADSILATIPALPITVTLAASDITAGLAVLNASINPGGADTTYYFQYGLDTNYGSATLAAVIPAGRGLTIVSNGLSGLNPATTYHFQIVAINSAGTNFGSDLTWTTKPPGAPLAVTSAAGPLTVSNATLNAVVNPNGLPTTVAFEYGADTNYGSIIVLPDPLTGVNPVSVTAVAAPFLPATAYHFRVEATNSQGSSIGSDMTFATAFFRPMQVGLPNSVYFGAVAWGDYDNDGNLDFIFTGPTTGSFRAQTTIWHNNGGGSFSSVNSFGFVVNSGAVAWSDFDNDGFLECAVTGYRVGSGSPTSLIYYNSSGTLFAFGSLPDVANSAIAFGDFNNDGMPDLFYSGSGIAQVAQYYSGGGFNDIHAGLPGVNFGSAVWADFDNDGWLDLLFTGRGANGKPLTRIMRNLGNGTFTNINTSLPAVQYSSVSVGDFDNDGYLDILISGQDTNGLPLTQVWRNLGNGTFTNINAGLPGVLQGSVAWGDYDNDGWSDILLTGADGQGGSLSQIWRNLGNGTFTNMNVGLPPTYADSVAWGDFDNDGRLDILFSGVGVADVFQSYTPNTNTPPTAPDGLTAVATGSGIRFSWNPGSDAQTPSSGLTYNLRVGTTPGGWDIVSPMSDPVSGKTRTPQMGNAQERLFSLVNVPFGQTYYWSVQSVDTSFAGSPFAAEQSIALTNPPPLAVTLPATVVSNFVVLNGSVNPNGTTAAAWFLYGLTTNYDTLASVTNLVNGTSPQPVSVAITGLVPAHVYHYQIFATNAGGPSSGADLTFVSPSAAPEITLVPPNDVTGSSAVLNTAVKPNGLDTFVYFAYGPTLAYGSFTDPTPIAIGATNVPVPLSRLLTGLNPGVTYHYLIYASNALGVATSPDQTLFTVANIPPSLSAFANVTTTLNTPTAAIPFNVSDAQISASNLVVTIMSGNTNLVPQTGFLVTGTGTNRTLTITPAPGRSGIVTIVVAVSDGPSTTYQGFTLSIGLVPGDTNGDGQVDLDELNTVILYYRHLLP